VAAGTIIPHIICPPASAETKYTPHPERSESITLQVRGGWHSWFEQEEAEVERYNH